MIIPDKIKIGGHNLNVTTAGGYNNLLPISTQPLLKGSTPSKENIKTLQYCDEHNLNASTATLTDDKGVLHLKNNCYDFKISRKEQHQRKAIFQMLTNKDIYDDPVRLQAAKKELRTL